MPKVGATYLIPDPDQDNSNAVNVRRIWLQRVPVVLIKKRRVGFKPYTVRTQDGREFRVGRLESPK